MENLSKYIGMNPIEPVVPMIIFIAVWITLFVIDRWILKTPYRKGEE